jgi:hypothetical protein
MSSGALRCGKISRAHRPHAALQRGNAGAGCRLRTHRLGRRQRVGNRRRGVCDQRCARPAGHGYAQRRRLYTRRRVLRRRGDQRWGQEQHVPADDAALIVHATIGRNVHVGDGDRDLHIAGAFN